MNEADVLEPDEADVAGANEGVDTGFDKHFDPALMPERISMEIFELDRTQATYLASINVYEKQRNKTTRRLEELKRKALDGRFHGGEVAIAKLSFPYQREGMKEAVHELLMNGQHQVDLVLTTGKVQKTVKKVFKVEKPEQLPVLWGQFDQPGGIRTASQVAMAYKQLFGSDWSAKAITLFAGAVGWLEGGVKDSNGQKLTIDERIELLLGQKYGKHVKWAHEVTWSDNGPHDYAHMIRQGVITAMIESHMKDKEKAEVFWPSVKTGHLLAAGTPQYAIREWLGKVSIGNTSGRNRNTDEIKQKTSSQDVYIKCMVAFNTYVEGRPMQKVQLPKRKRKRKAKAEAA